MTPEEEQIFRKRQRSRSIVTAVLLGVLAVLFFAITMAKIAGPDI